MNLIPLITDILLIVFYTPRSQSIVQHIELYKHGPNPCTPKNTLNIKYKYTIMDMIKTSIFSI